MAYQLIPLLYALISAVIAAEHNPNERVTALSVVTGSTFPAPIALKAATFADLIKDGNIFVDKTLFIKDILDLWHGKFRLIDRPYGWGKSVMLDMIRKFFEIEFDSKGDRLAANDESSRGFKLFERGEIVTNGGEVRKLQHPLLISKHKDVMKEHRGQYPVLYMSLSGIKPGSLEELHSSVATRVREAVHKYDYKKMIEKVGPADETLKRNLEDIMQSKKFAWSDLKYVCQLLEKYFERKPLILVDDYDEPMLNIFTGQIANDTNLLVKSIADSYGDLLIELDRGKYFTFAMMTGTIKLTHDNFTVHGDLYSTRDPRYIQYHGINVKELNMICNHLSIPKDQHDRALFYYGGYQLSEYERNVSNPSSIAKFVANRKIQSYFVTHPTIDKIMTRAIENGYWRRTVHRRLSRYIKYRVRYINTYSGLNIFRLATFLEDPEFGDQYDSEDVFLAYAGGYLTNMVKERNPCDNYYYQEVVPNEEVRLDLKSKLQSYWALKLGFKDTQTGIAAGVPKLGETFKQFLLDDKVTSAELCDNFLTFIHNVPNFKNQSVTPLVVSVEYEEKYSRLAYNILNFVILYIDYFELVDSVYCYGYRDRDASSEISLRLDTRAMVAQMSFAFKSVEQALNKTRSHRFAFLPDYRYPGVEVLKRIGINYSPMRKVEVLGEIITEASKEVKQFFNDTSIMNM